MSCLMRTWSTKKSSSFNKWLNYYCIMVGPYYINESLCCCTAGLLWCGQARLQWGWRETLCKSEQSFYISVFLWSATALLWAFIHSLFIYCLDSIQRSFALISAELLIFLSPHFPPCSLAASSIHSNCISRLKRKCVNESDFWSCLRCIQDFIIFKAALL